MAREKLQSVLKKTLKNLDSFAENNDILRRRFSGVQTHTLDFRPVIVRDATLQSLARIDAKPTPDQLSQIDTEINKFCNGLKAAWNTQGYEYTVEADGKRNIFRSITESTVYKNAKNQYNIAVSRIINSSKDLKFIDAGHSLGYGVSESALAFALGKDLQSTVRLLKQERSRSDIGLLIEKIPYGFLKGGDTFKIKLEVESKAGNRSTAAKLNSFGVPEQAFLGQLREQLTTILSNEDWGSVQGSPSPAEEAVELIVSAAKGTKVKKSGVSKASITKKVVDKHSTFVDSIPVNLKKSAQDRNWASLIGVINARLPEFVRFNMVEPALVNRTGEFSESARVVDINTTPQGYPSFGITYNKTPYGVFDRATGALPWATPPRDPYTIIERSLRQMLTDMAIGRFYVRRV